MAEWARKLTKNYTDDEFNDYLTDPEVETKNITVKATRHDELLHDAINELCNKCGKYETEHLGSCDGCRWLRYKYE